ncbi:MAG: Flp pilus assembly complex ATPase component TadA [Phycisphaerales bacterium]|nr:Flp pilus assembly complex ATPase component TadA [Phycisphaerales bacterium]
MNGELLLVAGPATLVSWWKPVVLLLPLVGWAWVVSRVLDKHAARFYLPQKRWNLAHLIVGFVALAAAFLMPVPGEGGFWAGLGAMILILCADVGAYWFAQSRDERVPEGHKLRFNMFQELAAKRAEKAIAKKAGKSELQIKGPDKGLVMPPGPESPEFQTRVVAEQLFIRALENRAAQVDLGPTGKDTTYGSVLLIDGVKQAGEQMPAAEAFKVIDFWKGAAKLDLADRRRKLSGDINVERGVDRKKVRIMSSGTQGGMRLTMLMDPEESVRRKPDAMGLLEPQLAELKSIVQEGLGVVLLAAPPDGGRTTTMYTLVKMHDAYTSNVQTIETDIQDAPEGVRQNKWDPQAEGPDFSTLVRSILRRDPNVVALADLPDQATAKEVAKADQERTRIYVSLRADGALPAIQMWMKTIGDAELGSKCLHGVVAQKLVRKLCINCRMPYQPTGDQLKKLGLPADKVKQLFKKGGQVLVKNKPEVCNVCQGTGYTGQEGVFEVYLLGQAERDMIKEGNWNGLRTELRKKQLPGLLQAALKKAVDGTTSLEEVGRIGGEGGDGGGSSPAKPAAPRPAGPAAAPQLKPPAAKPAAPGQPATPAKPKS